MNKNFIVYALALLVVSGVIAGTTLAHGFGGRSVDKPNQEQWLENHAEILGISSEELQGQLDSGKDFRDLAVENGLTMEKIHKAHEEQMKEYLTEMVTSGQITQEEADARLERMELHEEKHEQMLQAKAEILGLSVDELKSKLESGQSFRDIATEQGVELEDFGYGKGFRHHGHMMFGNR